MKLLICMLMTALTLSCAQRYYGYYHRVKKGETLYRIAKAYDVNVKQVVRANNMRDAGYLREGQFVLIPGRARAQKVAKAPKRSYQTPQRKLHASNLRGRFIWPIPHPVRKTVLRPFGKRDKKRNLGIDIAAPFGANVVSAAAGTVVYAGDGIEGFGKTVIVRHAEDIFSIYSHLLSFQVTKEQAVRQGESLGRVGRSSQGLLAKETSFLHFEIRERTIPVNPQNLLP